MLACTYKSPAHRDKLRSVAGEGGIEEMAKELAGLPSPLRLWRCSAEETVRLARRRSIARMPRTAARYASLLDELMQRSFHWDMWRRLSAK
jgi:hypothetical protein